VIKSTDALYSLTALKCASNKYLLNWLSINYQGVDFYEIKKSKYVNIYVVNFAKIYTYLKKTWNIKQ